MKTASEYFEDASRLEDRARTIRDPIEQHQLLIQARYWRQFGDAAKIEQDKGGEHLKSPG
jgi:hypothetical protein